MVAPTQGYGVSLGSDNTWTGSQHFPGSGTNSERVGSGTSADGDRSTAFGVFTDADYNDASAFGYDANANGLRGTAIGCISRAAADSVSVGYSANGTGTNSVGVGRSTVIAAQNAVVIGFSASAEATENGAIAIGESATVTEGASGGGENIAIGQDAAASEWRAVAVGAQSEATAVSATALGWGASAGASHAIAIGRGSWTDTANEIAIGFTGADSPTHVYFESGHAHKFVAHPSGDTLTRAPSSIDIVVHGFDAFDDTDGMDTDVAGGDLLLAAGRGTGTAAGGSVKLQAAPAGGVSNNTKNTLVDVVECDAGASGGRLGFFAATPGAKPTVTGSRGSNAALASLLTALSGLGLLTDSSS